MNRLLFLVGLLGLAGCTQTTQDIGYAGKNPGMIVCGGTGSIVLQGQAGPYGGSGNVIFSCGTGAYFGQGYPAANLPLAQMSISPGPAAMPPLGPAPPQPLSPGAP